MYLYWVVLVYNIYEMEWKDIDYWMLILDRYYWLQEKQMECDVYFKSYIRLNRILNKMDDEWVSREYDEDMF